MPIAHRAVPRGRIGEGVAVQSAVLAGMGRPGEEGGGAVPVLILLAGSSGEPGLTSFPER